MAKADPLQDYLLTPHATFQMARRGLEQWVVRKVLEQPEQRYAVHAGRDVLQARMEMAGVIYLFRVFVDVSRLPVEVVTAYRTSKIEKYWRTEI